MNREDETHEAAEATESATEPTDNKNTARLELIEHYLPDAAATLRLGSRHIAEYPRVARPLPADPEQLFALRRDIRERIDIVQAALHSGGGVTVPKQVLETVLGDLNDSLEEIEYQRDRLDPPDEMGARAEIKTLARTMGTGVALGRAIRTNSCLGADEYGEAIAETLVMSAGDVCFGILAPWGRGKTHLGRVIERKLPEAYSSVWFSAWKYRARPELWAFLYEKFRTAHNATPWWQRYPQRFRAATHRTGKWSPHLALVVFALSAIPLGIWLYLGMILFGIIGLARLGLLYWKRQIHIRMTLQGYLGVPSHSDVLGLQGAISENLTSLIRGWTQPAARGRLLYGAITLWSLSLLCVCTSLAFNIYGAQTYRIPFLGDINAHASALVTIVIITALFALGTVTYTWLLTARNPTRRVALFVDDLDRVSDTELIDIIESLRLFLEESEISDRLQVVFLCQEDALHRAIVQRYRQASNADFIQETLHKLLVGYIRLPPWREESR